MTRLHEKPWPSSSIWRREPLLRPHSFKLHSGCRPSSSASSPGSGYSGSKMHELLKYSAGLCAPRALCTQVLAKAAILKSARDLTATLAVEEPHTKQCSLGGWSLLGCRIFFRDGSG